MTGRPWAAALAAACVLLAGGCVPASPDGDTYRDQVVNTSSTAVSEVATVQKVLELLQQDRLPRPAAVVQLRDSEDALEKATSSFTSLNPPVGADDLSNRAGTLLQKAGDLLEQARVAVHRDEVQKYAGIARDLDRLSKDLESLERKAS